MTSSRTSNKRMWEVLDNHRSRLVLDASQYITPPTKNRMCKTPDTSGNGTKVSPDGGYARVYLHLNWDLGIVLIDAKIIPDQNQFVLTPASGTKSETPSSHNHLGNFLKKTNTQFP